MAKKFKPGPIEGQTIVSVAWLTEEEATQMGFDLSCNKVQKLMLSDGSFITAMCDPEGNGPGWIIQGHADGGSWHLMPKV